MLLSRPEEDRPIPINIDPTLFRWDIPMLNLPLQITWHGFFTAVGTLVGIWLAVRWAVRAGYTEDDTFSVAMWGVVGAIIGARLFHVVDQWDLYSKDPLMILRINEGGLAIYGTIVGGPVAGALYAWHRKLNVPRLADVAAAPLVLGMAIGRIGDIINGEHHGVAAEGFPLAFVYTNPATLGELNKPVHLAVGYEMVLDLAIFCVLVWMARGFLARSPRALAVQLAAALSARRYVVLDVPGAVLVRPVLRAVLPRRYAVCAGPEPGAAAVGTDGHGRGVVPGVPEQSSAQAGAVAGASAHCHAGAAGRGREGANGSALASGDPSANGGEAARSSQAQDDRRLMMR